jgi:hypothetical protein
MKMSMTVKKLITELEKIENKLFEVECYAIENRYIFYELDHVSKRDKKVVIFTKDNRRF